MNHQKIIIIGAGPAGLAAGLQLKREGFDPLLLERATPGGLLLNANLVENYLGFPGGIKGHELVARILDQTNKLGLKIIKTEVQVITHQNDCFEIETSTEAFTADYLLVASGTQPNLLPHPELPQDCLSHVFYETYPMCQVSNSKIAIIGSGDAAYDYALNLTGQSRNNQVIILSRGAHSKALDLLQKRVAHTTAIELKTSATVNKISSLPEKRLQLEFTHQGQPEILDLDYLLIAIGRKPSLGFLNKLTSERIERLQESGSLYLVGDVDSGQFRQSSIAMGEGIKTAMKISQLMKENNR